MRRFLVLAAVCAVTLSACTARDPRAALGTLNVEYSAGAFVAQAGEGDTGAVRLFLAAGMPPNSRDARGSTPLIAAASGGHAGVARLLLDASADPNLKNDDGVTALAAAAWKGQIDVARALVDKGADVLADKPVDQLPIMRAIRAGHHDIVALLLDKGAHAYVQDDLWSPLILASFLGQQDTVEALIARHPDINAKNGRGMTSLMHAASRGHAAIVGTLLTNGADVNAQDAGGHTSLMFAANNGQMDALKVLLEHHADSSRRNRTGATAASFAAANGHADIVSLLKTVTTSAPRVSQAGPPAAAGQQTTAVDLGRLMSDALIFPEEKRTFAEAAAAAWRYVDAHYRPATGLIDATKAYAYTTVWDIGSGLGALYAGHQLGLIETADYDRRIRRALATLATVDLFDGAAFNKVYSTRTATMVGLGQRPSSRGYGWSAIDLGRLLVWLNILAVNEPQYREAAAKAAGRLAMPRLVANGYLIGEDLDRAGAPRRYQEGRIGYEQYAARGFAAWNAPAERALRLRENGTPITVMGRQLLGDLRGGDRITSDPLILLGLELGWDRETGDLATQFLATQEARYRKTGRVTLVAEDAIDRPPFFFYYYCALANGKDFGIDVQDPRAVVDQPRWVSAKAAFAWHALRPSAYTALALQKVQPARSAAGWGSGVYEASGASTGTLNINTAAVILEAALVHARGGPILK